MDTNKKDQPGNGNGNGNGNGHDDDHGQGGHNRTTIIVNTREKEVEGKIVTYDQIVALAFENPPTGANIEITVAYRDGPGPEKEGTLQPGGSTRIKKDMIFDVTATDKS
ncbi:multiubiquitin domain-containing protein [Sphingopyxis sp. A083]|uniref:multiubiquitin domain-containing protein n=1 Tax=Sphingopyxis sp. A083 TaxID=1759083 RepID=UPI0009E94894|nr:multiubiquitin domain-containing protein [Sphingopyxis sp. A083]